MNQSQGPGTFLRTETVATHSSKCKHARCWMIKRPVMLFPARIPYSLLISCFPWLDSSREAKLISCYVENWGGFSFCRMGIWSPRALQGSQWGNGYNKTHSLKHCPWHVKNKHLQLLLLIKACVTIITVYITISLVVFLPWLLTDKMKKLQVLLETRKSVWNISRNYKTSSSLIMQNYILEHSLFHFS